MQTNIQNWIYFKKEMKRLDNDSQTLHRGLMNMVFKVINGREEQEERESHDGQKYRFW